MQHLTKLSVGYYSTHTDADKSKSAALYSLAAILVSSLSDRQEEGNRVKNKKGGNTRLD